MDKLPKEKWYCNTFLICILAACAYFGKEIGIACVAIALVLAIFQLQQRKKIHAAYIEINEKNSIIQDADQYSKDTKEKADQYLKDIEVQGEEKIRRSQAAYEGHKTQARAQLDAIKQECANYSQQLENVKSQLDELNREVIAGSVAVFEDPSVTSEECKNKLSLLKVQQNDFIKSPDAVSIASSFAKKVTNNNVKQLLRCFNAECASLLSNVTVKNADSLRGKLQKAFETINKIFETDGVSLNPKLLEMKLEELTLLYNYELKKEQEKEEQKAIREQMLEEEKTRREIEREKAKIEKEEKQFQNEITKLMAYMQKAADIEKQLYMDKIKELEDKLKLVQKDKENVLQREQNTRAGYVYVISNIGSFGEDVYKIGMTRRLEPMDRVKELGDASVPFEFDVHAMIFSEDAPALETILHQTFAKYMVNKVNPRKEFFKVPLEEIKKVVQENHNATVTFTMIAEAVQYRESLKLAANQ